MVAQHTHGVSRVTCHREPGPPITSQGQRAGYSNGVCSELPEVCVSAIVVAIVDPAVLMAVTVIVYLLSSLRFLRVYGITVFPGMVTVSGSPISKHLLTM